MSTAELRGRKQDPQELMGPESREDGATVNK